MNNLENGGGWMIHTQENYHLDALPHPSRVPSLHFCPTHTHTLTAPACTLVRTHIHTHTLTAHLVIW